MTVINGLFHKPSVTELVSCAAGKFGRSGLSGLLTGIKNDSRGFNHNTGELVRLLTSKNIAAAGDPFGLGLRHINIEIVRELYDSIKIVNENRPVLSRLFMGHGLQAIQKNCAEIIVLHELQQRHADSQNYVPVSADMLQMMDSRGALSELRKQETDPGTINRELLMHIATEIDLINASRSRISQFLSGRGLQHIRDNCVRIRIHLNEQLIGVPDGSVLQHQYPE